MSQFRLRREYPTTLEITVTSKQIASMFPIEVQHHPVMGVITRVWKTQNKIFSVESIPNEHIIDLSGDRKHIQVKQEYMLDLLSKLEKFEITLFYEDKEDVYTVERINN